jgi:hypothetical protein
METYRLTRIPVSYSVESIRDLFLEEDQKLIIGPISLAKSVYAEDPPTKVSTISFRKTPSFIVSSGPTYEDSVKVTTSKSVPIDCLLKDRVKIKGEDDGAQSIRLDNVLEGLTPLFDPESDLPTVE